MLLRRIATLALLFLSLSAFSHEYTASISAKAESPSDGSLWIGTSGDGLFRLGRKGRKVHYTVESGHLASNGIVALQFDINKVLWILDDGGRMTSYTAVTGFKQELSFPEGVTYFTLAPDLTKLVFATDNCSLYFYDVRSNEFSAPLELPAKVSLLFPSVEDYSIWGITNDGALRIHDNGSFDNWSELNLSSNLIPFEFDTYNASSAVKHSFWWAYFVVIALILSLSLIVFLLFKNRPVKRNTVPVLPIINEPLVEEIKQPDTLSVTLDGTSRARGPSNTTRESISGDFSKKVISIIDQNYSDPDFDVEVLAQKLGLSRIHLNRKLKAEGTVSPSVILKEVRMSRALELLKSGNMSVSQVGEACGFSRHSYFATAFKEYYGKSPSEFLELS